MNCENADVKPEVSIANKPFKLPVRNLQTSNGYQGAGGTPFTLETSWPKIVSRKYQIVVTLFHVKVGSVG